MCFQHLRSPRKPADDFCRYARRRHQDQRQILSRIDKVPNIQQALPLLSAPVAERQQPAQLAPSTPVGRVRQNIRRAVAKHQPCARVITRQTSVPDLALFFKLPQCAVKPHDTSHGIAISQADGLEVEHRRRRRVFLRMRCALKKRKIRSGCEFSIGRSTVMGHASTSRKNAMNKPLRRNASFIKTLPEDPETRAECILDAPVIAVGLRSV